MSALSSEKKLNHAVATISPVLRPTLSENQPPVVAPRNMPKNVADVIKLIVLIDMPHCMRIAGAAKAKVLMSPNSKKKQKQRSARMCQWKALIGKRSRREAAEARFFTAGKGIATPSSSAFAAPASGVCMLGTTVTYSPANAGSVDIASSSSETPRVRQSTDLGTIPSNVASLMRGTRCWVVPMATPSCFIRFAAEIICRRNWTTAISL